MPTRTDRAVDGVAFRTTRPEISGVVRPHVVVVCLVLLAAVGIVFCVEIASGDFPLPLSDVVQALGGQGHPSTLMVVQELRLPRALTAVLVGVAFGASGALFQALTRNPLASPDMIGITAGASTAAVAGLVLGFSASFGLPALALIGGLCSATAIYLLAYRGGTSSYRIVLVGIGVSAVCLSVTSYLLLKAGVFQAQQALIWLIGSLDARGWEHVFTVGAAVVVLLPIAIVVQGRLKTLQLGDDVARGLGVPVARARFAILIVGVGLVAFGTAASGPIAFVALIAPQIGQRLVRLPSPALVPSALVGALLVLVSDLAARQVIPDVELPVGVITGLIGAPYLLWLLARVNRIGSGG